MIIYIQYTILHQIHSVFTFHCLCLFCFNLDQISIPYTDPHTYHSTAHRILIVSVYTARDVPWSVYWTLTHRRNKQHTGHSHSTPGTCSVCLGSCPSHRRHSLHLIPTRTCALGVDFVCKTLGPREGPHLRVLT